jgi:DNA-binding NtrC family response regulator
MGGCKDPTALPESLRLRLGVLTLPMAPLRERREDILPLFWTFLEGLARQEGRPLPTLERGTERDLLQRAWPGNARQLSWTVAQAWRATTGTLLAPLAPEGQENRGLLALPWPRAGTLEAMLDEVERSARGALLRKALEAHPGTPLEAARDLGLSPRVFARLLRDHGISLEDG